MAIVGGCGHVGLPLGIILAEAGYPTRLYDLNETLVASVNSKVMPHLEEEGPQRLGRCIDRGALLATTDATVLGDSAIVVVTIGTPVDEHLNPRLQDLMRAMEALLDYVSGAHQLIVFRSTLAPGTLQVISDHLRDKGCQAAIAYCPERIVQGKALTEMVGLPQIISGLSESAVHRSRELFLNLTGVEPILLSPLEAELAKLFCNAWRYISFAISNQFYQIAESSGANFAKIHQATTQGYPRMKGFAAAGLTAGPCLLKDTMQLAAFSQNTFFLGHSAMLVNEGMPVFMVQQLMSELGGSLRGKRIALLGLAFKPDNDDTRESLSFKLRKLLIHRGAQVLCHDPYVRQEYFPAIRFADLDEALACEALVIGVPHKVYRELKILPDQILIDVWGAIQRGDGA